MERKKNILILSNSINTRFGYAVIFSEVARALKKSGYNVYYFGMQDIGISHIDNDGIQRLGLRYDPWTSDVLEDYLRICNIDILLTGMDLWMDCVAHIPRVVEKFKDLTWIAHVTVNASPISPFMVNKISRAKVLVVPSQWGTDLLIKTGYPTVEYIPHFISPEEYYPPTESDNRHEFRERFGLNKDNFVFISVMRNKGNQKNYPAMFKSFRRACDLNKEFEEKARIVLVTDPIEPEGMNLILMRQMYRLDNHIIFVNFKLDKLGKPEPTNEMDGRGMKYNSNQAFGPEYMKKMYWMSDVNVQTSSGESFGLPILESMACGIPQLTFRATTGQELVETPKAGMTVTPAYIETMPALSDLFLINMGELTEDMLIMFDQRNKPEFKQYSENAINHTKNYLKEDVMNQWVKLVDKVSGEQDASKQVMDYHTQSLGL